MQECHVAIYPEMVFLHRSIVMAVLSGMADNEKSYNSVQAVLLPDALSRLLYSVKTFVTV